MKVTVRPYRVQGGAIKTLHIEGVEFTASEGVVSTLKAILGAAQILWPEALDLKGVFIGHTSQKAKKEG